MLFVSCETTESELISSETNTLSKKSEDLLPLNPTNSYDFVGQVHYDISTSYFADSNLPKTIDSIVSQVNLKASIHPFFDDFLSADYNLVPQSRIVYLVSDSHGAFDSIVDDLPLNVTAKNDFRLFVETVLSKVDNDEDYIDIHNYIVHYESTIQDSGELSASEKEYLLTVTSIIRHSVYAKKKRPKKNTDLDWYWLNAKFTGAVEGAQYGKSHAILTALKAGIIENK
ncbi:hypothetical protein [Flavobacterium sp.]|uniref:hypothetical protein n=1 Tax=Flavobacterium sp. TaxID=239 RepID=UPI00261D6CD6|nr:hypothetical protein [Flavobacterium sp.]MDD3005729.1 hypothetical protein [Flavobacterium sp.]